MHYGLGMPARGPLATAQAIEAIAQRAEAAGFTYLSVPDHVVMPRAYGSTYPYSQTGAFPSGGDGAFLEQLAAMTYMAGVTEKARLLTSVMVVPHRHPVLTAKILTTIDVLSQGRVTVGVGAGWLAEEFAAIGAPPFAERGKVTDEYLSIFKELWTGAEPRYAGDYASFENIYFEPKPVQKPHPPIWVGGESPVALRRVARHGDAWFPIGANPRFPLNTIGRYREAVGRLKEAVLKAGRDPATVGLAYWANWYKEDSPATTDTGERHLITGSDREVADDIGRLRDAGVGTTMCNLLRDTLPATLDSIDRFAQEVIPKVR